MVGTKPMRLPCARQCATRARRLVARDDGVHQNECSAAGNDLSRTAARVGANRAADRIVAGRGNP